MLFSRATDPVERVPSTLVDDVLRCGLRKGQRAGVGGLAGQGASGPCLPGPHASYADVACRADALRGAGGRQGARRGGILDPGRLQMIEDLRRGTAAIEPDAESGAGKGAPEFREQPRQVSHRVGRPRRVAGAEDRGDEVFAGPRRQRSGSPRAADSTSGHRRSTRPGRRSIRDRAS